MNNYEATITLTVRVEAFDSSDVSAVLEDTFGPGEECGILITNFKVNNIAESK